MHDSWLASSPLRRTVDRVERAALALAIGLAVAAVPIALLTGAAVHRASDAIVAAENAAAHPATALLLRDAPTDTAALGAATTLGEWHTDGTVRTGPVDVMPGATAGTTVSVWLDDAGRPVAPPLTADQAYWRGFVTVVMLLLATFALITSAYLLTHWLCERRRIAEWAADWRAVEPRWTHG
ncbi:MAG TPA: hypothetical protein VGM75_27555 [Pseudonocardiaceae bacterium]|jgi:hypothetical protein